MAKRQDCVRPPLAFLMRNVAEEEDRGVICCAGIGGIQTTVSNAGDAASLDYFKHIVSVNLFGSFNLARLVAARIVKAYGPPSKPRDPLDGLGPKDPVPDTVPGAVDEDRGVIILTSSVAYQDGQAGQAACRRLVREQYNADPRML